MSKRKGEKGKTSALVLVAALLLVAVFLGRKSAGVSTLTAFSDAFMVSGCAVSLPLLLAYVYSREGADGFSYAAWRGFLGVLPFLKREESYRAYKARREAQRKERQWDFMPLKVGGVLCAAGLVFALVVVIL